MSATQSEENSDERDSSVRLKNSTRLKLKARKRGGESYDELIRRLLAETADSEPSTGRTHTGP